MEKGDTFPCTLHLEGETWEIYHGDLCSLSSGAASNNSRLHHILGFCLGSVELLRNILIAFNFTLKMLIYCTPV